MRGGSPKVPRRLGEPANRGATRVTSYSDRTLAVPVRSIMDRWHGGHGHEAEATFPKPKKTQQQQICPTLARPGTCQSCSPEQSATRHEATRDARFVPPRVIYDASTDTCLLYTSDAADDPGGVGKPSATMVNMKVRSRGQYRWSAVESYTWSPSHDQCGILRPFGTSSADWW